MVLIIYSEGGPSCFEVGLARYSTPSEIPKLPLIPSKWRNSTIFISSLE
jgi:hypothetical protein